MAGFRRFWRTAPLLAAATIGSAAMSNRVAAQESAAEADPAADASFEPIFDGKSFDGWEGDETYWRVEGGVLIGEITPETVLKQNSFIIWRGGVTRDFELKLDVRITDSGNSGVNYRSEEVEGTKFALRGYQADIDGANKYTGQCYEERGRAFLALRGDVGRIDLDGKARVIGSVGNNEALAALIPHEDFNALHIIARGNVLTHLINGRVMCVVVDDDVEHRKFDGLLGMQVHVGPPMKVEYKNIRLKRLSPEVVPKQ